jgi:hypothetical protein
MPAVRRWSIGILIDGKEDHLRHAEARLKTGGGPRLVGMGCAREDWGRAGKAKIGDVIAAAGALLDLVQQLLRVAADSEEPASFEKPVVPDARSLYS